MKLLAIVVGISLSFAVAYAGDTTNINGKIITTGMTTAEVLDRAGQPDRIEDVQNGFGAKLGERWEYHDGRKMVTLWIRYGKVDVIEEAR